MKLRIKVILFALFLPGLVWLSPAGAHTSLISQEPAGNSVIEILPNQISLTFDESLIVIGNANVLTVIDPNGSEITIGDTKVLNNVVSRSIDGSNIIGKYSVTYRVVSEDGHVVSSTYQFTLKGLKSAAPNQPATPSLESNQSSEPTANERKDSIPIKAIENNPHASHSFWGEHAGHFYMLIAAIFLIFIWKRQSK
jgi:methionine-rich copper-binding protein CopC